MGFHVKEKEFDWKNQVMIRVISDVYLPFDQIACNMSPVKPINNEKIKKGKQPQPDLNAGFDPLIKVKLPNKKVGLLFPNTVIPCDVNRHAVKRVDSILIHIHGGGFVSQNSNDHLGYLRKFARNAKTCVFAIDYRHAPENPFPAALDDVWQAYVWIIRHSTQALGITPAKIILSGDSAGGNLAIGLTSLCLLNRFRVPD